MTYNITTLHVSRGSNTGDNTGVQWVTLNTCIVITWVTRCHKRANNELEEIISARLTAECNVLPSTD